MLAVKHFEVYVASGDKIVVYSDQTCWLSWPCTSVPMIDAVKSVVKAAQKT